MKRPDEFDFPKHFMLRHQPSPQLLELGKLLMKKESLFLGKIMLYILFESNNHEFGNDIIRNDLKIVFS